MTHLAVSQRNRKIGIILIVWPWILIISILFLFGFMNALLNGNIYANEGQSHILDLIRTFFNFFLGLLGFICVLGSIIGTPIGIYFLVKKVPVVGHPFDERSGKGALSTIPEQIQGWNWGAAGLTWVWGIGNGVWISLLSFLPFFNWFFWIILGFKGNEWAWKKVKWESVDEFQKVQKQWKLWGVVFLVLRIVFLLLMFFTF